MARQTLWRYWYSGSEWRYQFYHITVHMRANLLFYISVYVRCFVCLSVCLSVTHVLWLTVSYRGLDRAITSSIACHYDTDFAHKNWQ